VSPLEKQRNRQHDICCLVTNTWANRVAIVSFVTTRYLFLTNIGQSLFNLQICLCSGKQFNRIRCQFSCYCLSVYLFFKSFNSVLFCMISLCLIIQCSNILLLSVIFCSDTELYSRYFDPKNHKHQPSGKSINIIHQTAPSFVLV
jgi:hypothetical protein